MCKHVRPKCIPCSRSAQANNWPLRGGKHSNWDGGIRVNAFLSGGYVPVAKRGTRSSSLVALWDWYATLASIGGLGEADIADGRAAAAGLPPIDSIDQSAHLLGTLPIATSSEMPFAAEGEAAATPAPPRTELPLGSCANARTDAFCQGSLPGDTVVDGLIQIGRAHT